MRHHVSYTEPHQTRGTWTSPPRCLPSRGTAEELRAATTALAGPDAAARRTWTIEPCSGDTERCPR